MVANIEKKTLRERAYRALKDSILRNELLPGQDLSITSLAVDLGISETPVREALVVLKTEGLIDYESHKRPQVAGITEEDVRHVYEIRKLLEPHAARLVISSLSKASDLEDRLRILQKKAEDICCVSLEAVNHDDFATIDLELNEIFLEAAGKTLFHEVLLFVSARSIRIRTFVEAVSKSRSTSVIHMITEEHKAIIQAMRDRDADRAQQSVMEHLMKGESRTLLEIEKYRREH